MITQHACDPPWSGLFTVGWVEHGNSRGMVRYANRSKPPRTVTMVETPCVTHHFPCGSLHAPYEFMNNPPWSDAELAAQAPRCRRAAPAARISELLPTLFPLSTLFPASPFFPGKGKKGPKTPRRSGERGKEVGKKLGKKLPHKTREISTKRPFFPFFPRGSRANGFFGPFSPRVMHATTHHTRGKRSSKSISLSWKTMPPAGTAGCSRRLPGG